MRALLSVLVTTVTVLALATGPASDRAALAAAGSLSGAAGLSPSARAIAPGPEPITPETAARVGLLGRWGHGEIRVRAYSADGSTMAVGTWVGVAVYDTATWTEQRFVETQEPVG